MSLPLPGRCLLLPALVTAAACIVAAPAQAIDLQKAIDAVEASGELIVPAGVHHGPVVIRRPITLVGEPGATIDGNGRGDVIRIEAPDVVIRGLRIRGTGDSLDRENAGVTVLAPGVVIEDNVFDDVLFGIYLKQAPNGVIRNNRIGGKRLDVPRRGDGIRLWYSPGCVIERNTVHNSRDVVIWFSNHVTLRRNTVIDGRYGLHFMYCDDNVLEQNRLERNSVGAFLMYSRRLVLRGNRFINNRGPSGYGIGLKDMDGVTAEDNVFAGNRVGIYFDNSPASVDVTQRFTRNMLAYNDIALAFQPSTRRNTFTDNSFVENLEQVAVLGSGDFVGNTFTVDGRGNYWSDYTGYDRGGDGIGDVPYKATSLFENLMDREPKLRLFLFSPAQQAIELAANAVPTFKPKTKVTDTAPLMRPIRIEAPMEGAAMDWKVMAAALGAASSSALLLSMGVFRRSRDGLDVKHPLPSASESRGEQDTHAYTPAPILSVRALSKRYGRVAAVQELDLELRPGESLALWGPNGAGKTTTIRCILGLNRCEGEIQINGHNVRRDGKAARNCIGYVPQELAFYDDWRTHELLAFFGRLKRVDPKRVPAVLADVGLTDHARKRVGALSGGMKQRLALAAALLADPPLLLLDEITANLDAAARRAFLALLQQLRDHGKAILFTSHRLDEVEFLADRVLVMDGGRVVAECAPAQLAEQIGLRVGLRLWLTDNQLDQAAEVLRNEGYDAGRNGHSVCVRVPPDQKGRPLAVLHTAGLNVSNFEIDNQHDNGVSPFHTQSDQPERSQ